MLLNCSRLVLARGRRGLTQTALGEAVGVSVRSIKAYEAGDKVPTKAIIAKLAAALEFPVSFLVADEPLELLELDAVSFRSLKSLTAKSRDAGLAAAALAVRLNDWVQHQFEIPPVDIPDNLGGVDPEIAAEALRRYWGVGEAPIANMVHLLESKGVRVFSLAEDCRALDAFSTWRDGVPFVFLNMMKTGAKGRMDAAHELGHIVLHREVRPNGREAEDQATRFGAAFLMPRASLLAARLPAASLPHLMRLKTNWGVALSALVVRLHRLGRLTEWQYRALFVELSKKGYRTIEPEDIPRETSAVLQQMFTMLRAEGKSLAALAVELDIFPDELAKLVFGLCVVGLDGDGSAKTPGLTKLRLVHGGSPSDE
jgi:Zn-dependent peptidase ImmA (M78 family)/transcriptional regulator with XRE-family HTH domain